MNNSEREMSKRLAHPMGFGEPPEEIKESYLARTEYEA